MKTSFIWKLGSWAGPQELVLLITYLSAVLIFQLNKIILSNIFFQRQMDLLFQSSRLCGIFHHMRCFQQRPQRTFHRQRWMYTFRFSWG